MSNEELMRRFADGDAAAFAELCEQNMALIQSRTSLIAREYGCDGQNETLSGWESVGMLAFAECVGGGRYDESQGKLTTYVVPFIDGAIRRYAKKELRQASMTADDEPAERLADVTADASTEDTVRRASVHPSIAVSATKDGPI